MPEREAIDRRPEPGTEAHAENKQARLRARSLAATGAHDWFETLYQEAGGDPNRIPWADLTVKPFVREALQAIQAKGEALVVGCGLGDDVEACQSLGFRTTGFDLSPTAIEWARERFPNSTATYQVADLLKPPVEWQGRFQLVLEVYTLQAMPAELQPAAIASLRDFVAPGGTLVVVCRGRLEEDPPGELPFPLTKAEVEAIATPAMPMTDFRELLDDESPPVRRLVAHFQRHV